MIVVTDDVGALPVASRVKPLKKPFYFLPIVDFLGKNAEMDLNLFDTRKIICPGVRALIVDDEPMNLKVAEGILKNYQMQVTTVNSGKKAIEICGREEFDLIFLDHMMPEMDGVETLKQLRRNNADQNKRLTVIAFTANAVSGAREMFLQEGFDEFISKPVEMLELKSVLKKVLPRASITYLTKGQEAQTVDVRTKAAQPADGQMETGQTAGGAQEGMSGISQAVPRQGDELSVLEAAGFHIQTALAYCQGDREFYKQILEDFAKEAPSKKEKMRKFLSDGDWENYRILAHSMKSTARLIGADELSAMAKAAEDAARESDSGYLMEHDDGLMLKYSRTAQCILDALHIMETEDDKPDEAGGSDVTGDPLENAAELTKDDFKNYLLKLQESLDTFEADKAEGLLAEIKDAAYGGRPLQSILGEIISDVGSFELAAASDKTSGLLDALESGEAWK